MSDFQDFDRPFFIVDGIDDAVIALANPISNVSSQFFATERPRINGQGVNAASNAAKIVSGERFQLSCGRLLDA